MVGDTSDYVKLVALVKKKVSGVVSILAAFLAKRVLMAALVVRKRLTSRHPNLSWVWARAPTMPVQTWTMIRRFAVVMWVSSFLPPTHGTHQAAERPQRPNRAVRQRGGGHHHRPEDEDEGRDRLRWLHAARYEHLQGMFSYFPFCNMRAS